MKADRVVGTRQNLRRTPFEDCRGAFFDNANDCWQLEHSMKTSQCVIPLWAAVSLTGNLFAQSAGLVQLVTNSSLRMPLWPPDFGYATTNALGTLTFTDPVGIVSPPGH